MKTFTEGFRAALAAIFSDRSVFSAMLVAVVIYSFYYPSAYQNQVATRQATVVVDLDHSPLSRALQRQMQAVRDLDLIEPSNSVEEASRRVAAGEAEGIVVIDAHFERDILRGQQGKLTLLGEGAYLGRASTVLNGLSAAISGFARDAVVERAQFLGAPAAAPFTLVQRPLFNTREGYASAVVSAVSVLIVQQTLMMGVAVLAGTLRERKGSRLALGGTRLAGVLCALWLIGMLNLLYYAGFVTWFQDFPRGGNLPGLLLAAALYVAAVVLLATFVGSFFRVREHALQGILLTSMPLFFLTGASWPVSAMPVWLTWVARLAPTTSGTQAILQINGMGARLSEVQPQLLNLAALIVLYGGLTWWRYRERDAAQAISAD
ncbi:MAG: ABC transporter permease [Acidovorax sp.]